MPLHPFVTYFLDPYTMDVLSEASVVMVDDDSNALLLPAQDSKRVGANAFRLGEPLDWRANSVMRKVEKEMIRSLFLNDPQMRWDDLEELRRVFESRVTKIPESLVGSSYIGNGEGHAFPVEKTDPIVMRKGVESSLVSLTMYEVATPSRRSYMPHRICVRPAHGWWASVPQTVLEVLRQHFSDVPYSVVDGMRMSTITKVDDNQTVVALSFPVPIDLEGGDHL